MAEQHTHHQLHHTHHHHDPVDFSHGHHHHGDGKDYAAANRDYFDEKAKDYDAVPGAQEAARRIVKAILEAYGDLFKEDSTTVLDYACGTGLISRELCPHVKSIFGVDISQGMVDQYNLRVTNQGIPPEEMHAIRAELKGEDTELDGKKFDVIVCSLAYHHFESIQTTTKILTTFLKPGGSLIVADIFKDGEGNKLLEHAGDRVPHQAGFSREDMSSTFEGAGLGEFSMKNAAKATIHGVELQFFVSRGVKPAA